MLAGNRFPAVFLVEDSYVQERIHPAAVDEKMILEWFER
jgi:hypothetical protein